MGIDDPVNFIANRQDDGIFKNLPKEYIEIENLDRRCKIAWGANRYNMAVNGGKLRACTSDQVMNKNPASLNSPIFNIHPTWDGADPDGYKICPGSITLGAEGLRTGGKALLRIAPAITKGLWAVGEEAATNIEVSTFWTLNSSRITVTNRATRPHGNCLTVGSVGAYHCVFIQDSSGNLRQLPKAGNSAGAMEFTSNGIYGFHNTMHQIQLNSTPDRQISEAPKNQQSYLQSTYSIAGAKAGEIVVVVNGIFLIAEVSATAAVGEVKFDINASKSVVAACPR